jgi:hypothetical protein
MTRRKASTAKKEDHELEEAFAVLISSTRNKKRPFPLTHVAKWLEVAVAKLGSYSAVAHRIGISPKMLRQFSYVRRLAKPVQKLFELRKLDSVDALAHLAMLRSTDQRSVAHALASGHIDTIDVRAVVELREDDRFRPIHDLIEQVETSKTKKEYVVEFIIRGNRNTDAVRAAITRHIPEKEIVRLEINGIMGRLVLTPKGKESLGKAAKKLVTSLQSVMPAILQGVRTS